MHVLSALNVAELKLFRQLEPSGHRLRHHYCHAARGNAESDVYYCRIANRTSCIRIAVETSVGCRDDGHADATEGPHCWHRRVCSAHIGTEPPAAGLRSQCDEHDDVCVTAMQLPHAVCSPSSWPADCGVHAGHRCPLRPQHCGRSGRGRPGDQSECW